jgi:hypothetical protein
LENEQHGQFICPKRKQETMREVKSASRKKIEASAPATGTRSVTQTAAEKAKPAGNGQSRNKTATIKARIDVGFGNTLFLRGEGQGLSWTQGVPLKCVDGSTWTWSGEINDALKFKLLLNDSVWSQGDNILLTPGQKVEIAPAF